MHKLLAVIALVVLAGSVGAVSAKARPAAPSLKPSKPACFASVAKLTDAGSSVMATGWCKINGKRQAASLTYKYNQFDPWGYQCGDTLAGKGGTFPLKYANAYSVNVTFKAARVVKGRVITSAPKTTSLTLGSRKLNCQRRSAYSIPPPPTGLTYVCGYVFKAGIGNTCGVVMGPDNRPLPNSAQVPYWTDHPIVIGGAFYAPPFASPSGPCEEQNQSDAVVSWMGNQLKSVKWVCPDGTYVVPKWYIYLSPDDPHGGNGFHSAPSCRAGDWGPNPADWTATSAPLPFGGTFSHFTLPSNWIGRVDVEVRMLVIRGNGSDSDILVSSEYADNSVYPNSAGKDNGCSQLLSFKG